MFNTSMVTTSSDDNLLESVHDIRGAALTQLTFDQSDQTADQWTIDQSVNHSTSSTGCSVKDWNKSKVSRDNCKKSRQLWKKRRVIWVFKTSCSYRRRLHKSSSKDKVGLAFPHSYDAHRFSHGEISDTGADIYRPSMDHDLQIPPSPTLYFNTSAMDRK